MVGKLRQIDWLQGFGALVTNAGYIYGTQVITSGLGFVYWWLAAQYFKPEAVGRASAIVSAMLLIGDVGVIGLDIFIVGELPRQQGHRGTLISTAIFVVAVVAGTLGIAFGFIAPLFSAQFAVLNRNILGVFLFSSGTALTAVSIIVDQAMIGLLRGGIQFLRNLIFSLSKLGLLWLIVFWSVSGSGLIIYISWVTGSIIALILIGFYLILKKVRIHYPPKPQLVTELGKPTLEHYALNLTLRAPSLILPLLVTVVLSAEDTAYYYVAWMISGVAFVVPMAFSTVLYAVGSGAPSVLSKYVRFTLSASALIGGAIAGALFIGADIILRLFGPEYSSASWALRILALGLFPIIIRTQFIAIRRVRSQINKTTILMAAGAIIEIVLSTVGALAGGLTGLTIGWIVAMSGEALFIAPYVYKVMQSKEVVDRRQPLRVEPKLTFSTDIPSNTHDSSIKFRVVMENLIIDKPVEQICEEYHITGQMLLQWQQEFLANGHKIFENGQGSNDIDRRITEVERQLLDLTGKVELLERAWRTLVNTWSRRLR